MYCDLHVSQCLVFTCADNAHTSFRNLQASVRCKSWTSFQTKLRHDERGLLSCTVYMHRYRNVHLIPERWHLRPKLQQPLLTRAFHHTCLQLSELSVSYRPVWHTCSHASSASAVLLVMTSHVVLSLPTDPRQYLCLLLPCGSLIFITFGVSHALLYLFRLCAWGEMLFITNDLVISHTALQDLLEVTWLKRARY